MTHRLPRFLLDNGKEVTASAHHIGILASSQWLGINELIYSNLLVILCMKGVMRG